MTNKEEVLIKIQQMEDGQFTKWPEEKWYEYTSLLRLYYDYDSFEREWQDMMNLIIYFRDLELEFSKTLEEIGPMYIDPDDIALHNKYTDASR